MNRIKPVASRSYHCRCGRPIFFRNSQCLACKAPLGYEPALAKLSALEATATPGQWTLADSDQSATYLRCANLDSPSGCNWLVPAETGAQTLCKSCRLDRTIPDLSIPANQEAFRRVSIAKRRLVSLLIALGLPVDSRVSEDSEYGLAFDFLHDNAGGPHIVTGHDNGIITLNIEEAEDATRERIRDQMGESYRTLLGHLRHEVGHYYWDRLVSRSPRLDEFRTLFGDDRQDYAVALEGHYQQGPPADWQQHFVTAYASSHPWEDWAETWAHYLHMMDTFDSALSFGLDPDASVEIEVEPFAGDAVSYDENFLRFVNSWVRLTAVLNELSRAMGLPDFYPFVLSRSAAAKLHFVHVVVNGTS